MNMEWVTHLKHHTHELQTQMQMFCQTYPPPYRTEQSYMERLLTNTHQFQLWVSMLPEAHETEVWHWVNWRNAAYDAKVLLSVIHGYFDLLLVIYEEEKLTSPALLEDAQMVRQHLDQVLDIYQQSRTTHDAYAWSAESETVTIPGSIVLAAMWPLVYPWAVDRTLSLNRFAMRDWPSVHYHPYHTPNMLYTAISTFMGSSRNICITPHKTEHFFEIHLTALEFQLRPDIWDDFLTQFRWGDSIERLRELGGNLHPLAWDMGQGQGMIIQLPWE